MTPFYNGKNASYRGVVCTEGCFGTLGLGSSSSLSVVAASFGPAVGSQVNGKIMKYVEHGHCGRAVGTVAERSVDPSPFSAFCRTLVFLFKLSVYIVSRLPPLFSDPCCVLVFSLVISSYFPPPFRRDAGHSSDNPLNTQVV